MWEVIGFFLGLLLLVPPAAWALRFIGWLIRMKVDYDRGKRGR